MKDGNPAYQQVDTMTRTAGASSRTFKNALIWCLPDESGNLAEEARKVLAWEAIQDEQETFHLTDEAQKRQLIESLARAKRDLQASVWRSYRRLLLLGKDNTLKFFDLGQMNASGGALVSQIMSQLQQRDELVDSVGAGFLVRNWPPAFTEWSTRMVRDAFFASPQLRRLLRVDILKTTIAQGVTEGVLAYVGKTESGTYEPFYFKQSIGASSVDISDEMFIISAETAKAYLERREQEETLAGLGPTHDPADEGVEGGIVYTPGPTSHGHIEEQPDQGADPSQHSVITTATAVARILTWTGEIPPQKWVIFYTKLLTGLVNAGDLTLRLTMETSPKDGFTAQRIETIKATLRELGLPDKIETE